MHEHDVAVLAPPAPLRDVQQMAAHPCGALAFLHDDLGLIRADVKAENVVRSSPAAPLKPSTSTSLSCWSSVKLVDLGNCFNVDELVACTDVDVCGGFGVQTVAYRAPEWQHFLALLRHEYVVPRLPPLGMRVRETSIYTATSGDVDTRACRRH